MSQQTGFQVPESIRPIRDKVRRFVDEEVIPHEEELDSGEPAMTPLVQDLMAKAKAEGLWALGHPKDVGGQGLGFFDYAYVNEVIGRSHSAQLALGTTSLQTSIMLHRHASPAWVERALKPLVEGDHQIAFAITEPDVPGSDPTGTQTTARLDGDEWVINGNKWFISLFALSRYVVVGARTEGDDVPKHKRMSMIIVPVDTPGLIKGRDLDVMGLEGVLSGHYHLTFDDVRVPNDNLIGERGNGFVMAQDRLGPGRIFHCMRWLGVAQRAFDIMCRRANSRIVGGEALGRHQLIQKMVFDSYKEIQAARLAVLDAATKIDRGEQARIEISAIKVEVPQMTHRVIDRAVQVHGALGVSNETPLDRMYRSVRSGRLVDGADEVHISRTGRRLLDVYAKGGEWDFGTR